MSFGFSLSDFALCAEVSLCVYRALNDGPNECKSFAQEVLHLHSVLERLQDEIEDVCKEHGTIAPLADRQPGLSEHGLRCFELLLLDISKITASEFWSPRYRPMVLIKGSSVFVPSRDESKLHLVFSNLKERCHQANFSRKIPRYREAVAGTINKLTAESVLLVRYRQEKAMQSQQRIEESQAKLMSKLVESQDQSISVASAIQESHIRIENQLHQILKAQTRDPYAVLGRSLDASSPEGRQTWMELGRLLREEGITPNVISKNKRLLVQAMKKTIERVDASPDVASFKTALEYQSFSSLANYSSSAAQGAEDSASLLGSAPSLGAAFPCHFTARQSQTLDCLDHEENINNGMESLMSGMEESSQSANTSLRSRHETDFADGHDRKLLRAPSISDRFVSSEQIGRRRRLSTPDVEALKRLAFLEYPGLDPW